MSKGKIVTGGSKGNNYPFQANSLKQLHLLLQRLTATGGSTLIADTVARTGQKYYSFIVQEDTVISVLSGGTPPATTKNYLTTMGLSGKTLKQGALISVPIGEVITNITLTSGSVIAYE